jgi:ATP-dependent DNA helicase RecQ
MGPTPENLLARHWGFDRFRPGQRVIVDAVLRGEPVLAVMPTGAGKSLCYQLPALLLDGLTVVVSPLIALMKDQVDSLVARGIPAACLNSSLDQVAQREVLAAARDGHLKLLYVAPERFRYPGAMAALARLPVVLLAVDEAHCISQWGHDFRPDYRNIREAWEAMGAPRIAAFTATATPVVRRDILSALGLAAPSPDRSPADAARVARVEVSGFLRDNLHLSVVPIKRMAEKLTWTRDLLRVALAKGGAAIVYCATRKHCDEVHTRLRQLRVDAMTYHGGLADDERARAQERFQAGDRVVMVATNAFGMGVDKPDVRLVIHWDLPGTVDAYYQEAGRAGRDGQRAQAVLLFTQADTRIHEFFIRAGGESLPADRYLAWAEAERQKLRAMVRFAWHTGCRHRALLRYFGESPRGCEPDVPEGPACDNCRGDLGLPGLRVRAADRGEEDDEAAVPRDLSEAEVVIVQKVLSAVARASGRLTTRALIEVLRGVAGRETAGHSIVASRSFGLLATMDARSLSSVLDALGVAGCWRGVCPSLTPLGVEVMWRRAAVPLAVEPFTEVPAVRAGRPARPRTDRPAPHLAAYGVAPGPRSAESDARLEALRARRLELARDEGVPPYRIASNRVLEGLLDLSPEAPREQWLALHGVGERTVDALREAFGHLLA